MSIFLSTLRFLAVFLFFFHISVYANNNELLDHKRSVFLTLNSPESYSEFQSQFSFKRFITHLWLSECIVDKPRGIRKSKAFNQAGYSGDCVTFQELDFDQFGSREFDKQAFELAKNEIESLLASLFQVYFRGRFENYSSLEGLLDSTGKFSRLFYPIEPALLQEMFTEIFETMENQGLRKNFLSSFPFIESDPTSLARILLSDDSPVKLRPLTVINRFDELINGNLLTCGDVRLVYFLDIAQDVSEQLDRSSDGYLFHLIFEGTVWNGSGDVINCAPLYKTWNSFGKHTNKESGFSDSDFIEFVSNLVFFGVDTFQPITYWRNFGSVNAQHKSQMPSGVFDASRGRVRAISNFHSSTNSNWHFRQWRLNKQSSADPAVDTGLLRFEAVGNDGVHPPILVSKPSPAVVGIKLRGGEVIQEKELVTDWKDDFYNALLVDEVQSILEQDLVYSSSEIHQLARILSNYRVSIPEKFKTVQASTTDGNVYFKSRSKGFEKTINEISNMIADSNNQLEFGDAKTLVLSRLAISTCGGCHSASNSQFSVIHRPSDTLPNKGKLPSSSNGDSFLFIEPVKKPKMIKVALNPILRETLLPLRYVVLDNYRSHPKPLPTDGENIDAFKQQVSFFNRVTPSLQGFRLDPDNLSLNQFYAALDFVESEIAKGSARRLALELPANESEPSASSIALLSDKLRNEPEAEEHFVEKLIEAKLEPFKHFGNPLLTPDNPGTFYSTKPVEPLH